MIYSHLEYIFADTFMLVNERETNMHDFKEQMEGKRLTTVEILYHLPDHPSLLQTYVWQTLDVPPQFPRLQRFLMYWQQNIDGRLHSVKLTACETVRGALIRGQSAALVLTLDGLDGDDVARNSETMAKALDRFRRLGKLHGETIH